MILIVDNLQVMLPLLVVSLKLVVLRWKRTAIVLLVKMMAEDWMELKMDAERNVMIKRAQTARLIIICGFFLMIFVFIVLIILPAFGLHFRYITNLTDQERLLPFQAYYFYDTNKSPQFEIALVIQAATMFLGATTYTSVDAFLGLLILHICGQLENFKHRLTVLTSCKDFDSALCNNVQTHLRIIRFANNIEDTFALLMLGLVFYFGIVFCLFGFLFVTVITGNEMGHMSLTRVCFIVIGIFTLMAHTFLYCGAGEIIAEQKQPGCYRTFVSWTCVMIIVCTSMTSGVCVFALVFGMDIAKHSQYKDFTWAIKLNRLGLELLGLWPKSDEISKNNFSSDLRVVIIFVIVTFVSGIPLACSLIRVWGDMILMIDNLQITLPLLVVSLKLVVLRWKQTALLSIIKMMAEDWMELKTRKERDVMMRRAQIARIIVISGYVLMILAFIVVIVLPYFGLSLRRLTNLTDPGKPLPLQTYYFYNVDKSPQFELTYIIQAITVFLAAVTYTSVDAFLGFSILHFSGQLENFKSRITSLISCQNFIYILSHNIMTHIRLIRFAGIIENTFTFMMLSLVFYFGIVFCLHGFLLLTVITEGTDFSFARLCFPLIGITILLSHTFLYCGAGEIITMQVSYTFFNVIYINTL
ncbi:OR13A protein, partial [Acromyrmex insinuator]